MVLPEILGVGYEITDKALNGALDLQLIALLIGVKLLLTALTLGTRFGGGVFSPSVYLGALTGGGFALGLALFYPYIQTHYSVFALAGMGGVAAAVLGAPLSTILISFELVGDYQTSLAITTCVAVSSALAYLIFGDGYFHLQAKQMGKLNGRV